MQIEKTTKQVTVKKMITPARYIEEDTGRKQLVTIIGLDGLPAVEERPIKEKIYHAPVFTMETQEIEIWTIQDGDDTHEFLDEKSAIEFSRGAK